MLSLNSPRDHLESVGLPSEGVVKSMGAGNEARGRKRDRSVDALTAASGAALMDADDDEAQRGRSLDAKRLRSLSQGAKARGEGRPRGRSATRGSTEGSVAPRQQKQLVKAQKSVERHLTRFARAGEADREHYPKLVKHLNSGKRSLGTSTIGR